ncbi:hypothetical protein [Chitinophaga polysaccharea]|uniref:hypothetical protein n=1 Tax=Chitinophaga polysaccharea TaxID=1293035 RepID=UPI001158DC7F|nr:hypothetical protein [Chitinophaga polysaccharea]
MEDFISKKTARKTGIPDLVEVLRKQLSSSELSSLLLEVYQRKSEDLHAAALLQQYRQNIYVQPADTDMIEMLEKELQLLRFLRQQQYEPVELSPVAQFGSCAAVGTVNQKKIITAVRHTEVLADATNSLALHIADMKQQGIGAGELLRYCTVHSHVRAMQLPPGKGYTPHFKIACMAAAGRDTGNFEFELSTCTEQLQHIYTLLHTLFGIKIIYFKIQPRNGYSNGRALMQSLMDYLSAHLPYKIIADETPAENNYYKGIQFKAVIQAGEHEIEIADGGLVDWTQQLLGNNKERCFISGIGLSLLMKLFNA